MRPTLGGDDFSRIYNYNGSENNKLGRSILLSLKTALVSLKNHEDELNRLNVYPVPDGDTGTNMMLTMQSVINETAKAMDYSLNKLAPMITHGSLIGARGNSGVILSQIIRGICEELSKNEVIDTDAMINSIKNGEVVAYRAVMKPVEGTMLTVIKDMASAAEKLSGKNKSIVELFERMVEEGKLSVERTPSLLPILKEAGVVDAGGYGLLIITQGILAGLKGERIRAATTESRFKLTKIKENIEFAYCTELILKCNDVNLAELENKLEPLGDSMMVVGTHDLVKIHIHTNKPGEVLNIATSLGFISGIDINNIVEQSETRANEIAKETALDEAFDATPENIGVVAVANGVGIKKILQSLGVDRVVYGGQSMNPSTADILKVIDDVPFKNVIVLPNNSNIILAAEQTVGLTEKNVSVLRTKSIPEAFAAMTACNKESGIEDNVSIMADAISQVKTGELTNAVRADVNGNFEENDFIGLHDHIIKATGSEMIETALALIAAMVDENDEVVTILAGDQVSDGQFKTLAAEVERKFPNLSVDIHRGDQPIYHLILGIE